MLQQRWREPVAVSYFQLARVSVPRSGLRKLGYIPLTIVLTPYYLIRFIVALPYILVSDFLWRWGYNVPFRRRNRRTRPGMTAGRSPRRGRTARNHQRFAVTGREGTAARQAGEAIKDSGSDIWFAWSATRAALLGNGQIRWEGSGHHYPYVDLAASTLIWPDRSTARFDRFGLAEAMRIRDRRGYP